jgi:hypothetical protein
MKVKVIGLLTVKLGALYQGILLACQGFLAVSCMRARGHVQHIIPFLQSSSVADVWETSQAVHEAGW